MIKKLLVAVLAMAMVIGTMAVSAFAADDTKYYVVGTMNGWDCAGAIEMTDAGDGVWTYTFDAADTTDVEFKIVTEQGNWDTQISIGGGKNGGNFKYTPDAAGKITITLDVAKIADNNAGDDAVTVAAATADAPADDTPAGDSTAVMGYVVAAVVALAAVVTVISKKRSVEA